jgi:hypothetical protein
MSGIRNVILAGGGGQGAKYNGTVTLTYDSDYTTYEDYYYVNGSQGSASPTTLTDGKQFFSLGTYYGYPSSFQYNSIIIKGFSSDPGSSYLASITIGGTTYSLVGAFYSYASGQAEWDTQNTAWFFAAGSYSVILT